MADENEAGTLVHRSFKLADDGVPGVMGIDVQHLHLDAVSVGDVPAGRQYRAVLQVAGDDLVALLPVQAAEDDVQALGGVAGDQRLVNVGAQQVGGGAAGFLLYLAAALVDAGGGRPLLRLQRHPRLHGLGSSARGRPGPAGVHVGQVLEDGNFFAQLLDVHTVTYSLSLAALPGGRSSKGSPLASAAMRRSFQASHSAWLSARPSARPSATPSSRTRWRRCSVSSRLRSASRRRFSSKGSMSFFLR